MSPAPAGGGAPDDRCAPRGARPAPAGARPRSRVPLGEQVALALLEKIVTGAYPPGASLPTEVELAAREGVSRLTLREATGILRHKNVIDVRRGRGTVVRPMVDWSPLDPLLLEARARHRLNDLESMENLLEARRLVEIGVAELAARRRDDSDLQTMAEALARMRGAGDDLERFVDADIDFHDALLMAARNPVVGALFSPLRELIHAHRRSTSQVAEDRAQATRAHKAILDAVVAGRPEAAGRAMARHLRQTEAGVRRAGGQPVPRGVSPVR